MEYFLAYGAGLLTLINPCVLPILPIVIATSLQQNKYGPVQLAAGMSFSFVLLSMSVTVIGSSFGINDESIVRMGAYIMVIFGSVMLVPPLAKRFSAIVSPVAARADIGIDQIPQGKSWKLIGTGALMAAVWSPCIGPTLGGAIGLASQGQNLLHAGSIMVFFSLGVATLIILLGYGARSSIMRFQSIMRKFAQKSQTIMGVVFVSVGLGILFDIQKSIEIWAIQNFPPWLIDFSVSI